MSTVATLVVALQGNIRGFTRSLDLAESRLASFGKGGGGALTGLGISAIAAAGVVAAMSFKMAVDFESAMAGVRKTVEATDEQFEVLTESIREMSRTLPFATTEIAGVAEAAGQLGVAVEDIEEFTSVMLDLGVSTNLTAQQAAISLARFMNVMDEPIERVRALGDVIVSLGNSTATTESEILNMATRLTGISSSLGIASEDVLGVAAAMTELGIPSEKGGTAFQKFAITVAKAVSEAGDDLRGFATVAGVTTTEFATLFGEDAFGALMLFIEGFGQVEERGGDQLQILKSLGLSNQRLIETLLKLGSGYDKLATDVNRANDPLQTAGALAEEAGRRYDTMKSKITVAMNSIKSVMIDFGDAIAPAVIGSLDRVGDWFEKNGPMIRAQWDLIAAGLVPVGAALVFAAEGFGEFITMLNQSGILVPLLVVGLGALVGALAPVMGTVAVFIAIRVAIGLALKVLMKFRDQAQEWSKEMKLVFVAVAVGIALAFGPITAIVIGVLAVIYLFRDETAAAFSKVIEGAQWLADNWRAVWADILEGFAWAVNKILSGISIIVNALIGVINFLGGFAEKAGLALGEIPDLDLQINVDDTIAQLRATNAIHAFIRGLPSQQPGAEEFDEQADVTAAFAEVPRISPENIFGDLPDIFGDTAAGVDKLKDALDRFLETRLEDEFAAFVRGGPAAVQKLRSKNAILDAEFQKTLDAAQKFGLDVSFLHRDVFERTMDELEKAGRDNQLGDLLMFLISRRLGEGLSPTAGLLEKPGGGDITIEQINITPDANIPGGIDTDAVVAGIRQSFSEVQ